MNYSYTVLGYPTKFLFKKMIKTSVSDGNFLNTDIFLFTLKIT